MKFWRKTLIISLVNLDIKLRYPSRLISSFWWCENVIFSYLLILGRTTEHFSFAKSRKHSSQPCLRLRTKSSAVASHEHILGRGLSDEVKNTDTKEIFFKISFCKLQTWKFDNFRSKNWGSSNRWLPKKFTVTMS